MSSHVVVILVSVFCFTFVVLALYQDDETFKNMGFEAALKEAIKECSYGEGLISRNKPFFAIGANRQAENKTNNNFQYSLRRRNSHFIFNKTRRNNSNSQSNNFSHDKRHHNFSLDPFEETWDGHPYRANKNHGDNSFSSHAFENSNTKYKMSVLDNDRESNDQQKEENNNQKSMFTRSHQRHKRQFYNDQYHTQHNFRRCPIPHQIPPLDMYRNTNCRNCENDVRIHSYSLPHYLQRDVPILNGDSFNSKLSNNNIGDERKHTLSYDYRKKSELPSNPEEVVDIENDDTKGYVKRGKEAILKNRHSRSLREQVTGDLSSCTIQCALSVLQVVDVRGFPRETLLIKFLDVSVSDVQERMSYIRGVRFCLKKQNAYIDDDSCEYSKRLISCMGINLNGKSLTRNRTEQVSN